MKKILVFGGTRFFGKALAQRLIHKGYEVTIATRGQARDDFGSSVNRIIIDRENKESLMQAIGNKYFDVVVDNICYSPDDAKIAIEVLADKVGKYVVTSSMAVYEHEGTPLMEEDFDSFQCRVVEGSRHDFSYGEGKQLAEAVFFQQANFPVVAVRFPVVLGKEDYSKRLYFYCERIINKQPLHVREGELSFVLDLEAARFLEWCCENDYSGPINACSNGTVSVAEMIHYIEEISGEKAIVSESGEEAPYNWVTNYIVSNERASKLGFSFEHVRDYIFELMDGYIEELTGKCLK